MSTTTTPGKKIPSELNAGARWLLIGEAPGADEETLGRPFVGKSGQLLDGALAKVGLRRDQFNIANVCPWRPPKNDISKWWKPGRVMSKQHPHIQEGIALLEDFIAETQPEFILCVGKVSMWAMTGYTEILGRRGSIYGKVMATLHPAATIYEPRLFQLMVADLARFKKLAEGKLSAPPERSLVVNPTAEDYDLFYKLIKETGVCAADIESAGHDLACIGFAPNAYEAICVPWDDPLGRQFATDILLDKTITKIWHNSPYDLTFLSHRMGIESLGPQEDTAALAHTYNPEQLKDLATLTALYTLQPYYKDMVQDWTKVEKLSPEGKTTLYRYNCLDVCVTFEIYNVLATLVKGNDLWHVYTRRRDVIKYANRLSARGVNYDLKMEEKLRVKTEADRVKWQDILNKRIGYEINVQSEPQVSVLLYDQLKLPATRGRNTKEKTIATLYAGTSNKKIRKILRALLEVRDKRKFLSAFLKGRASADSRVRTSFNPLGTENARWSASKFLIVEGTNLQTVPAKWKPCFIPDKGTVLWEADYSQIEARLVAYDANDERQIAIFEDPNGDIHKENAMVIFGKSFDEITFAERYIGKSVHALNYGVGPVTLQEHVNKGGRDTGTYITLQQARRIRDIYLERFEPVVLWQRNIWDEVCRTHRLTNPFGTRRIFLGPTREASSLDRPHVEHTRKEALAFKPQSTVPDMLNMALEKLEEKPPCEDFSVLLNVHDSLVGQGPADKADIWVPAIIKAMSIPVTYGKRVCRVPIDVKVGDRWSNLKKIKQ